MRNPKGTEAAVKAMQKYLGVVDNAPVKVQQRHYRVVISAVDRLANTMGADAGGIWDQVAHEATRRGVIRPRGPGRDW